jgi:hypothetical protein
MITYGLRSKISKNIARCKVRTIISTWGTPYELCFSGTNDTIQCICGESITVFGDDYKRKKEVECPKCGARWDAKI